jgi:hypothetical protein
MRGHGVTPLDTGDAWLQRRRRSDAGAMNGPPIRVIEHIPELRGRGRKEGD